MARRCGCASDTCSCFIIEGPGIQISGSGTETNKYVISSDAANLETGVDVQFNNNIVATDVHQLDFRGTAVHVEAGTDEAVITIDLPAPPDPGASYTPPTGVMWMWAGAAPPVGWLLCDGTQIPIASYSALFAVIGTTWGGDGVTTFGLPPLMGRFPLGASPSKPLGGIPGGSETKNIATANLPPHNHAIDHDHPSVNTNSAGGHDHGINRRNNVGTVGGVAMGQGVLAPDDRTQSNGAHVHSVNVPAYVGTSDGGPGQATPLDVMPPYVAVNYIIKV